MLEKSILVREDFQESYYNLANQIDPETVDKCKEKYMLFDKAILKRQRNAIFIASKQGAVLLRMKNIYRENGQPDEYIFNLGKLKLKETTANFKIRLAELLDDFPKLKFCSLSLNVVNKYLRQIRKVCENSGERYK